MNSKWIRNGNHTISYTVLILSIDIVELVYTKYINKTNPSASVYLRRIGATHLKLTPDMRPYTSLFLTCRMLYALLSTIFHGVNFVPIIPVES